MNLQTWIKRYKPAAVDYLGRTDHVGESVYVLSSGPDGWVDLWSLDDYTVSSVVSGPAVYLVPKG